MNPYVNHNLNELITAISTGAFIEGASIKEVCEITPQKITTERESIYVVRALRKSGYFDEAYKFHEELKVKNYGSLFQVKFVMGVIKII